MTDSMLRLARAVYPGREWSIDRVDKRYLSSGTGRDFRFFDPANNADQFCDVLAWLACQTDVHINGECVATQHGIYKYEAGSGKGLAEAVVEAAMRVVE